MAIGSEDLAAIDPTCSTRSNCSSRLPASVGLRCVRRGGRVCGFGTSTVGAFVWGVIGWSIAIQQERVRRMNSDFKDLVRTCNTFNAERKPGEARFTLPADAVAAFVYDLTSPLRLLGDDELTEIEYALGLHDPDGDSQKIAIAIGQSLESMRTTALGVFHLLPGRTTDD